MTTQYTHCQCQHSCSHRSGVVSAVTGVLRLFMWLGWLFAAIFVVCFVVASWMTSLAWGVGTTASVFAILVWRIRAWRRTRAAIKAAQRAERDAYHAAKAAYYQEERLRRAKEAPPVVFEFDIVQWERELSA
jgi:lysylphosphatidylglycerol synthetase-like protein (DUF2156 family)